MVGILALLSAFIPFVGIFAILPGIVALVLGVVGRGKAKSTGTGGGMAIVGIVLGALAVLGGIGWIVATVAFGRAVSETALESTVGAGDVQMVQSSDLYDVGDCYNDGDEDSGATAPCDQPHDNEVFAIVVTGDEATASSACSGALFEDFVGTSYTSSRYYTNVPPETAVDGETAFVCSLYVPGEETTGSVEGAGD